jgi:hypothetical protein
MNKQALIKKIAALKAANEALLKAVGDNTFTDEQQTEFDANLSAITKLNASLKQMSAIEADELSADAVGLAEKARVDRGR